MILLSVLLLLADCAVAQSGRRIKAPNNYFTVSLQRVLFRELRLNYERTIKVKHSLRLSVGYQWPTDADSYRNYPLDLPNRRKLWEGYYGSVGYGHTIFKRYHMYIAGYLFYNYRFYEDKLYHYCKMDNNDSEISLESRYENQIGSTVRWGKKLVLNKKGKVKALFDFYAGAGFYFNNVKTIEYGHGERSCYASDLVLYAQPIEQTGVNFRGLIILGIDFGFGF